MRKLLLFTIAVCWSYVSSAQVFLEEFDVPMPGPTYPYSYLFGCPADCAPYTMSQPESGKLQIVSSNAGGLGQYNHGLGFGLSDGGTSVDLTGQVKVRIRLKSDVAFTLRVDLQDTDGYAGARTQDIVGDDEYHTYEFSSYPAQDHGGNTVNYAAIQAIQVYFNSDVDPAVSANVEIDWYYYGNGTDPTPPTGDPLYVEQFELPMNGTSPDTYPYSYIFGCPLNCAPYTMSQPSPGKLRVVATNAGGIGQYNHAFGLSYTDGTTTLDMSTQKKVRVRLKSDVAFTMRLDLLDDQGIGGAVTQSIIGDGLYHTYEFSGYPAENWVPVAIDYTKIKEFQIHFNSDAAPISADVTFAWLILGDGEDPCSEDELEPTITSSATSNTALVAFTSNVTKGTVETYSWDFDGDGEEDSDEAAPSHTFTEGTHAITLTVTNDCGEEFTATQSLVVTLACVPVVLEPIIEYPSANSISNNIMYSFSLTGGTPDRVEWDFENDGTVDSDEWIDYSDMANGTYTVKLSVFDVCGNEYSTTKDYTVSCTPVVLTPSITSPATSSTAIVNLTSSVSGGIPLYSLWDFDNDGEEDADGANVTHTFADGTHTVKLSVFDLCGTEYTTTQQLTVNNTCVPVVLTPSITSPSTSSSLTVNLTSSVTGGTPVSYAWDYTDDGSIDAITANASHGYTNGTHTVRLTVFDACNVSYTTTQTLIVSAPCTPATLVPVIVAPATSSTASVSFSATVTGGTPVSYAWDFDFDGLTDAVTANPTYIYTNGTHIAMLTVYDACNNPYSTYHILEVSYTCTPATLVPSITSPSTSATGSISFAASVTGGTAAAYAWDFTNDGVIDATTASPTHAYAESGTYTAKLTVYDGCGVPYTTTQLVTVSGVTDVNSGLRAIASTRLYPNPAEGNLSLEVSLKNTSNLVITLSDMMGRQVMVIGEGSFSDFSRTIDVSHLTKGMYTVNYNINNTVAKSELLMIK